MYRVFKDSNPVCILLYASVKAGGTYGNHSALELITIIVHCSVFGAGGELVTSRFP